MKPPRLALALGWVSLLGLVASGSSWAAAFQVEARTEAQAYQLRSYRGTDPDNPVLLPRRRLVQYLGLDAFELVTGQPFGFESSLRIYADLGLPRGEAALIDGLHAEDADLLYANVHYRSDRLELRLGRQVYVDLMDYLAFDGLKVRYVQPLGIGGIGVEAYGGLWVKGASLLGTGVYQPDGVRETDARRLATLGVGQPTLTSIEPLVGAKVLAENIKGISAAIGYRKALIAGKTDLERLALELKYGRGRGLSILGGLEYDLVLPRISQVRLTARYDHELFAVTAEAMRVTPVLTADSIFLYFATAARDELRLRVDLTPVGAFRFYGQVLTDVYGTNLQQTPTHQAALADPTLPPGTALGASLGTAARFGRIRSALDLTGKRGFGGQQAWVDGTLGYSTADGLYTLDGRLSVARIADGLNPLLQGTFFGGQLWGSYLLTRSSRLSLVLEENVNRFTQLDTKMFVLFDLKAML